MGNARAKDSQTYEGTQKKMQLYGALVAYTGAYQLSGDSDAQTNYEIVKKLLEEQTEEEKKAEKNPEEKEKEKEKNDEIGGNGEEKKDTPKDEQKD